MENGVENGKTRVILTILAPEIQKIGRFWLPWLFYDRMLHSETVFMQNFDKLAKLDKKSEKFQILSGKKPPF